VGTSWEKAITTVERDLARIDGELPPLFNAVETMRYLPNHELQQDETVDLWLSLIAELEPWPNPGRLGQYEAALSWSLDTERTRRWPSLSMPCLVLAFEHDVDSPPARAAEATAMIPGARMVEVAAASHLGVFTHSEEVATIVVDFFDAAPLAP
jgi:thioesterase CepJ